jgi:hypothetical protein
MLLGVTGAPQVDSNDALAPGVTPPERRETLLGDVGYSRSAEGPVCRPVPVKARALLQAVPTPFEDEAPVQIG